MTYKRSFGVGGNSNNPFGSVLSLLIFVGVLVLLFFMVTSFVKLLYLVAPVLLIATLLINYRLVADYVLGSGVGERWQPASNRLRQNTTPRLNIVTGFTTVFLSILRMVYADDDL